MIVAKNDKNMKHFNDIFSYKTHNKTFINFNVINY